MPGVARGRRRRARPEARARPPRRGDPRPRRLAGRSRGSRSAGSSSFAGAAALDGERTVVVGDERLIARKAVVIATGTTAAIPPIDGLARGAARGPTARRRRRRRCPGALLILGGGVVGVRAGPGVEQPRRQRHPGRGGGPAARRRGAVRERAGRRGARGRRASRSAPGRRRSAPRAARAGRSRCRSRAASELRGDELLVAVGRRPRTAELGLETVGVEADGYLEVDDRMRVGGSDWLYAIGDVNGRSLLTHMGKYQAWICADNMLGRGRRGERRQARLAAGGVHRAAGGRGRPHARAGADERGLDARAVDVETAANAGASFVGRNAAGDLAARDRRASAASSSAPPSSARRSPSRCTRRRSPSPARCRSSGSRTRCRPSRPAARSG